MFNTNIVQLPQIKLKGVHSHCFRRRAPQFKY